MGTTTQKMTDEQQRGAFTRRQFLKGSGVLVVGFSTAAIAPWEKLAAAAQGVAVADYPEFDLAAVDSFLEVHADGFVLIKIGKINNGQGTPTSWVMIAADELDVPLNRVQVRFGDTAATPDQGGTGGSNGISSVYNPLRQACATARQALLKMASAKLDVPVESLTVKDGVVSGPGGAKSVSYAELIGDHEFDLKFSNTAPVAIQDRWQDNAAAAGDRQDRHSQPGVHPGRAPAGDAACPQRAPHSGRRHAGKCRRLQWRHASRGGESALQGQLCSGRREDGMAGHPGGASIEGDLEKTGGAVVPQWLRRAVRLSR